MCVIAVCQKRKLSGEEMRLAWQVNPDGAGIAWVEDGMVRVVKGLMSLGLLADAIEGAGLPMVVHFRLASVGEVRPELTHPFPILASAPVDLRYKTDAPVLFHNGHWARWYLYPAIVEALAPHVPVTIADDPIISDARAIASLAGILGEEILEVFQYHAGLFAVVYPDGRIRTYGRFHDRSGVLFSNLYFLPRRRRAYREDDLWSDV